MGDRGMEGQRLVVGSQDQRFNNDVGVVQRIPARTYIYGKGQNVEGHGLSWHSLFRVFGIYIFIDLYCSRDPFGGAAVKFERQKYDYYLIILTTLILLATGIICLFGIIYYNYLAVIPAWTQTVQYLEYIDEMNANLYPFLVLLLITLGLCIPKRLFEQDFMIKLSILTLAITLIITILLDIETGLGFILAVMTVVQSLVLILTLKKSRSIRFEKEGDIARIGSSLLHLGIVILIFNFVSLRDSPLHITIFWGGMIFITVGNIFSFYPDRISWMLKLL